MKPPDVHAPHVLVVDDDRVIREALGQTLRDEGYSVTTVAGITTALSTLDSATFAVALVDIRLKDGDGLELLQTMRARWPELPVIMATAYGDSERTISAMKHGAFEYLTKPFDLALLLSAVQRAVRVAPTAPVIAEPSAGVVGASPEMLEVWKMIGRAATSTLPVLITGETGVGKELVARAIHEHSGLDGPFVAVNIAALSPGLIESELFGHEKGAFTGAVARRPGRFELAQHGSLFLDEIGDLDVGLQAKLLRVLEDGSFQRVGGTEAHRSNARIITATSRDVDRNAADPMLRDDLFYRVGVVRVHVPPLRQRIQDIPLLADAFLRQMPGPRRAISEAAMDALSNYDWPGNVRQLRYVLQRACVMSPKDVIDISDVTMPSKAGSLSPLVGSAANELTLDAGPNELNLRTNLERLERELIVRALAQADGNRALAARLLGIRRALLYARIKQLGLEPEG